MKKFIPIISTLGLSALTVGLTLTPFKDKKENYLNEINSFKNEVAKFASINNVEITSDVLDKYSLSLEENEENNSYNENLEDINISQTIEQDSNLEHKEDKDSLEIVSDSMSDISTIYSLSEDIGDSCNEFCQLKNDVFKAINETELLIKKLQNKELNLTDEQRLFISEQAQQLKNLGRRLSAVTTELMFNLSDLSVLMSENSDDLNQLSLKYLAVLDNLVNGNEMLQSGLASINLINQIFNMKSDLIPSNNTGRVLYGFQNNNNPPIIREYYIDENGKLIENNQKDLNTIYEENPNENNENNKEKETSNNIDSYKNTNLKTNLDTYQTNNLPHNIDSFYNTALLDNEFMYGNANYNSYGYGINNPYFNRNPYMNGQYNNTYMNNQYNKTYGDDSNQSIQNNDMKDQSQKNKKTRKFLKLKKNIDTFKDENEPHIKTKLANIKNSITGFFKQFKTSDLKDKVENPVYRFNVNEMENLDS